MMQCPNCGAEVRGTFCTNCGTRVAGQAPAQEPVSRPDPDSTAVLRQDDLRNFQEQVAAQDQGRVSSESAAPPADAGLGAGANPSGIDTPAGSVPPIGTVGGWQSPAGEPMPPDPAPTASSGWNTTPAPDAGQAPASGTAGGWNAPGTAQWEATDAGPASPRPAAGGGSNVNLDTLASGQWSRPLDQVAANPTLQRYLAPLQQFGKQKLAWVASALLLVGLFLPERTYSVSAAFISVSVSYNLWTWSKFASLVIILMALVSIAVAYLRDYKFLWVTAGITLLTLVIEFFSALTDSYAHPSWAWLLFIPGVILLLAAVALPGDPNEPSGDAIAELRRRFGS